MTKIAFPSRRTTPVIETDFMEDVAARTLAMHNASPIIVWTGSSRLGKTTTATWLEGRVNAAFTLNDANAFQARHYQATELAGWHSVDKTAMGAFHAGVLGTLDDGLYRRMRAHELAAHIVTGLIRTRTELVFVDEAGLYSQQALRGLVSIRDQAVKKNARFTLVLIGMDDLPLKLDANPQLAGRVHEWCLFEPCAIEDTIKLVTLMSDLWVDADLNSTGVKRQFDFIHKITGGVLGRIVPFVQMVEHEIAVSRRDISVTFLKAIHLRTLNSRTQAQAAARANYASGTQTTTTTNAKKKRK
jgi:hypothetical protein